MPSRSFPEKRPQEISRLKRRAEAASGARAPSAFGENPLRGSGHIKEGEMLSEAGDQWNYDRSESGGVLCGNGSREDEHQ
jgi:hypothetical protein